MIEEILPTGVSAVDTREDWRDIELSAEEEAAVGRAVEKRRREFVTARACARRALAQLGLPPASIPAGERGEPRWPPGVVGSITHCAGYRACALAHATQVLAVGIDAEPNQALPEGVLDAIARPEERAWLDRLKETEPAVRWDRLLFSAKEAVYKTWFPLARRWLGFEDAVLTVDPARHVFHARLLVAGPVVGGHPLRDVRGRWLVRDGLVLTAVALGKEFSPLN